MDEHIGAAGQEDCIPEVLRDHHYDGIVILPYSQNVALDKRGITQKLSLFSVLATLAGNQLTRYGEKFILCGEDTYGIERYKSTGRRKFESTTSSQAKLLSGYCEQDPERIHQIEVPNMNNTAQQIREVARLQRSEKKSKGKNIEYLVVT